MQNKRRFPRQPRAESLSLTVVSSAHLIGQGERIYCESVDISAVGLQVILDRFVPRDSRVDIWLVLLENRQTLHLKGRLSWVEGRDENGRTRFHAGIQLLPAPDSDFEVWLSLFKEE